LQAEEERLSQGPRRLCELGSQAGDPSPRMGTDSPATLQSRPCRRCLGRSCRKFTDPRELGRPHPPPALAHTGKQATEPLSPGDSAGRGGGEGPLLLPTWPWSCVPFACSLSATSGSPHPAVHSRKSPRPGCGGRGAAEEGSACPLPPRPLPATPPPRPRHAPPGLQ
jgi:hypothetical protein